MPNLVLAFLTFAAVLSAQQVPTPKAPETVMAEVAAEVIRARLDLAAAKRRQDGLPLTLEMRKLDAEATLRAARSEALAAPDEAERGRLNLEAWVSSAKAAAASADKDRARADLEAEARLASAQVSVEYAKISSLAQIAKLQQKVADIATHAKVSYPKDPLVDGVLHISDRRIPFNGRVTDELAQFVCGRIAFYNAVDADAPIFLVIDRNPGGSVMAGYMILQAMETSKAPVYVVVKGYAASMAAIITTLAQRSFVYPETIVLHHQAATGLSGNVTQLNEQLKWSKIWCERIFIKVSTKIGIPLDEFVAKMYQNVSTGDWKVHGDAAVRMKWATDLVERMNEDGVNTSTPAPAPAPLEPDVFGNGAHRAPDGRVKQLLPPLGPCDLWWLYDPTVDFVLL